MKKSLILALAGVALLSACGSSKDETVTPAKVDKAPISDKVVVRADFLKVAGRWQSPEGAVGTGKYLVLDIASDGNFSMDVRTQREKGAEISESGSGSATAKDALVSGRLTKTSTSSSVLSGFAKGWKLSYEGKAGTISGDDGKGVAMEWKGL